MDNQIIAQLSASLIEVTARNGASIVSDKIRTAKANKVHKETISELEEIIYDLLNDKAEIQRIAQAYEQELVAQKITKDDIKYITNNLLPILSDLIPEESREQMEQLKKILSIEALTIMQLIGFNYKKAIGEPLTLVLQKMIESKIPPDSKANIDYALLMARIALDEKKYRKVLQTNKQEIVIRKTYVKI